MIKGVKCIIKVFSPGDCKIFVSVIFSSMNPSRILKNWQKKFFLEFICSWKILFLNFFVKCRLNELNPKKIINLII